MTRYRIKYQTPTGDVHTDIITAENYTSALQCLPLLKRIYWVVKIEP